VSESTRDAGRCHAILGNNPEGGFSRNMGHHSSTELGNRVSGQQASVVRTDVATRVGIAPEWRGPAIVAFICVGSVLMIFRQTLLALERTWYTSRTFSHCFLMVPLFVYLTWIRRKQVAATKPAPNYWALPLIALLAIVWLLGNLGEVRVIQEFALVAILIALAWGLFGRSVVRVLAFPLALLFFAVPFGLGLIGPLQDVTAWFAVHALTLSNVPAFLENRMLFVPSGSWTVAEACSGIRYLFSSVLLGLVYASLMYRSRKRQLLFIGGSILVPVIANGVRAYGIVMLAYLTDNRLAAGVDHIVYGWLFFTLVNLGLFGVGLRWRETFDSNNMSVSSSPVVTGTGSNSRGASPLPTLILALSAVALLAPAPLVARHLWNRGALDAGWADPPLHVSPPWKPIAAYDRSWTPDLQGADREFVQTYVSEPHQVDIYWALYSGRQSVELVNTYNRLAKPKLWSPVADGFDYAFLDGRSTRVHRTLIQSGSVSRSLWTLYRVSGEYTASPGRVKFLQAKARLLGRTASTAVIIVGANVELDGSAAEPAMRDFLQHASFDGPSRSSPGNGTAALLLR